MTWDERFLELFEKCLARYKQGDHDFGGYYSERDREFLRDIGYKPREFFDFIEDLADEGEPAGSTALLIAAVRRDFLQVVQNGTPSNLEITAADLPTFGDVLGEFAYLPRIITKARAKLRGELDPDLMFGCGGDRNFLREHGNIHPADFLRVVWAAKNDDQKILDFVRQGATK